MFGEVQIPDSSRIPGVAAAAEVGLRPGVGVILGSLWQIMGWGNNGVGRGVEYDGMGESDY